MIKLDTNLDTEVIAYCDRIWNIVRRVRHEKKIRRKDFPPIVVCCSDGNITTQSYTHGPSGCVFHPLVENALTSKLGAIGKKSRYCDFVIGRCAEPNAANKLVKRSHGAIVTLDVIKFSTPYRPFTKEDKPFCPNCQHSF